MVTLYNIGISFLRFLYWIASWFSPKAKAFREGRHQQFEKLKLMPGAEPCVWFHCASLGEFEQGRPVMEALKAWRPSLKICLTFFSPSGYEARKNYPGADSVFYLPWDTKENAKFFIEKVKPSLAIFVKYEFWYHYASELRARNIPLLSISAIFRSNQIFFKPWGSLFRSTLKCFTHFFVQNKESVELLQRIGIAKATVAGDSRFDRVYQISQQAEQIAIANQFKGKKKVMVIGSAWPDDMDVLFPFIDENKSTLKFIIAPHEIKEDFLTSIETSVPVKTQRLSQATPQNIEDTTVLLIDNIGILSSLYRYGEFAYVGGGFGEGLHNILEAAVHGIPVFFGNKAYQKYQEAIDLVLRGGAFEVGNFFDLKLKYDDMILHPETYLRAREVTKLYVMENIGATDRIVEYCKKLLA